MAFPQQIRYETSGQALAYHPPEPDGIPSAATLSLWTPDGTKRLNAVAATASAVSWVVNAAAAAGTRAITLAAGGTGTIKRGMRLLLTNALGQAEHAYVRSISGTALVVEHPLQFAYAVADTAKESKITYTLDASSTSDYALGAHYQLLWEYTLGGTAYKRDQNAAVVLRLLSETLDDLKLRDYWPNVDRFRWDEESDYRPQRRVAWERLLADFSTHKRPWYAGDSGMLEPAHAYATMYQITMTWGEEFRELRDHLLGQYREALETLRANELLWLDENEDRGQRLGETQALRAEFVLSR